MNKKLKIGYIALCVICILNFIYDNHIIIASTHIGQVSGGILGKTQDFLFSLGVPLLILCRFIPLIVSIIVSVIVFKFYRNSLTKATANLAIFGFVPYLLFNVLTSGLGTKIALALNMMIALNWIMIAVGIIKVIYSIIVIVFMLKDIKRLSA
ncbi:MAG: hypothetical protein IKB36_05620 [Clostridia bacterium]|nr:hypothetical protein [Clostridia bacterium]